MKKRIFSLALAMVMLCAMMTIGATTVSAASNTPTIDGVLSAEEGWTFFDAKTFNFPSAKEDGGWDYGAPYKSVDYSVGYAFDKDYIYFAVKTTTLTYDEAIAVADDGGPCLSFIICPNKDKNEFAIKDNEDATKNSFNTGFFNVETNAQVWGTVVEGVTEMSAPTDDGYAYEIAIPVSKFNFVPADGDMITFDLSIKTLKYSSGSHFFSDGYSVSDYSKFGQIEYNLSAGASTDTGATDTGATDTGATDTGATDTGATDTGSTNTGAADTGSTTTGATEPNESAATFDLAVVAIAASALSAAAFVVSKKRR